MFLVIILFGYNNIDFLQEFMFTKPFSFETILNPSVSTEPVSTESSGNSGVGPGGSSGGGSSSVNNPTQVFDTTKLGNHLENYTGQTMNKTGLDLKYTLKYQNTNQGDLSRILAHVKLEHSGFFGKNMGTTPVTERLVSCIKDLNKNYYN